MKINKFKLPIFKAGLIILMALLTISSRVVAEFEDTNNQDVLPQGNTKKNNINVLSPEDVGKYKKIKLLQKDGLWKEADRVINTLKNDILMGHIEFQRYMHPKKYRSSFSELSDWLTEYSDHPGANRLYRLAIKRRGKARAPKKPMPPSKQSNPLAHSKKSPPPQKPKQVKQVKQIYSKEERKEIARVKALIEIYIQRGQPARAEKRLWAFEKRGVLENHNFDEILSKVATSYFFEGKDEKAFSIASYAAERSRQYFSQGDWVAGLTAWRLKDYNTASKHFQAVANSPFAQIWTRAAGAFWAARSEIRCQRPENVEILLKKALKYPNTFYGLIAARQLGINTNFNWALPVLLEDAFNKIRTLPGIKRAIALDQIGDDVTADTELRLVWNRRQTQERETIIALAAHLNLPASQALISRTSEDVINLPHSVLYPIPDWIPEEGFSVDKALLFAIMRQESYFRPTAKSGAGAMGLLQLMPDTASYITKDRTLRNSNKSKLLDAKFNMSVGQKYMTYLLEGNLTEGNLFKFATAYNGGPGNMSKWQDNTNYLNDPLFYIESIPARETRDFIERIFANLWIYRSRLGQPSPSLNAVASGAWPPYEPLDIKNSAITSQRTNPATISFKK